MTRGPGSAILRDADPEPAADQFVPGESLTLVEGPPGVEDCLAPDVPLPGSRRVQSLFHPVGYSPTRYAADVGAVNLSDRYRSCSPAPYGIFQPDVSGS